MYTVVCVCVQAEIQPRVVNAQDFKILNWECEQVLLCVFSTSGDGESTLTTVDWEG